jgi:hypothetical protein
MLKPLRAALGDWAPRNGRSRIEPIAAVAAAWAGLVGPELARTTRPSTIAGKTLVVITTSSAWSHQLSFLAPEILRALRAIPEAAGIEELRFRVGRLERSRTRAPVPRRPALSRRAVTREAEPAKSLDEAVERIRALFTQSQDAKRAHGWKTCRRCGVWIADGTHCAPCAGSITQERAVAAQRLMYDAPWLGYDGTAALIEALTIEEYERNRHALLERWWMLLLRTKADGRVSPDGRERKIASSYVLLKTGWAPQRITPAVVRNILGDDLMALLYET